MINLSDKFVECPKCVGAGYLSAFKHIKNGVCFLCAGNGDLKVNASNTISDRKVRIECEKSLNSTWINLYIGSEAFQFKVTDDNTDQMRMMWTWFINRGAKSKTINVHLSDDLNRYRSVSDAFNKLTEQMKTKLDRDCQFYMDWRFEECGISYSN
jgi:hypothetical protein